MSPTTSLPPKHHLSALLPCPHGSASVTELRALGLTRESILDFSASTNPLGPSPAALHAIASLSPTQIASYPDECGIELREALSHRLGIRANQIILGNGSVEILWLLALAYLADDDQVLVIGPTFGEYARSAAVVGAGIIEYRAEVTEHFRPHVPAIVARIRRERPRIIYLCNPNNPTGTVLGREEILALLTAARDSLLVVDEAYGGFADGMPGINDRLDGGNLLLLHSMTKDYGLAGLRLGYAVGPEPVIRMLNSVRPPWNLNVAAQAAGLAAIEDELHVQRARAEVRASRRYLAHELTRLGFPPEPSSANFLLVRVGDATTFRSLLLRHAICVRDCTSFGLPEYIRIGIRTRPECARLISSIEKVLSDG